MAPVASGQEIGPNLPHRARYRFTGSQQKLPVVAFVHLCLLPRRAFHQQRPKLDNENDDKKENDEEERIPACKDRRLRDAHLYFFRGFRALDGEYVCHPDRNDAGAKVSVANWWLWNQIPVTVGNIIGGWLLIGWPLFVTYGKQPQRQKTPVSEPIRVSEGAQTG